MSDKILFVVVGYKDKNIAKVVKNIKLVTKSENMVYVFDQHPINHESDFLDIDGCEYKHKVWVDIRGPAYHRSARVFDNMDNFSHICIISPDILLGAGWDLKLMDILNKKNVVLSGSGKAFVTQDNLFSLSVKYEDSGEFNKTQIVDKNFIFAKSEAFKKMVMPSFLKYFGENEYLSLSFLSAGYDIVSLPTGIYEDSGFRSVENTYHTFSLEHNYNVVVDLLNGIQLDRYKLTRAGLNMFLEHHGLSVGQIKKLPYYANDVSYNPYSLEMHGVDARRFIAGTKAIY